MKTKQDALTDARMAYSNIANKRLEEIAAGGSPSPLASPWLALQQAYQEYGVLQPAERALSGAGDARILASPYSKQRDMRWQEAVEAAQAGRLRKFQP